MPQRQFGHSGGGTKNRKDGSAFFSGQRPVRADAPKTFVATLPPRSSEARGREGSAYFRSTLLTDIPQETIRRFIDTPVPYRPQRTVLNFVRGSAGTGVAP